MMNWENYFKHTPSDEELGPGGLSREGFLKEGQTLNRVLGRDNLALQVLGYTAREVADLLSFSEWNGKFVHYAPNGKIYNVEILRYRGYQECPWGDASSSTEAYVTPIGTGGERVCIAGLMKHLIEEHGFFEGGSYRIAPETIIEMFGVERVPGSLERVRELKL